MAAFDPHVREPALAARGLVLERAPAANELIHDSYNALSLAYSFTETLGGAFCHVALYTAHVNLGFNRGARRRGDPSSCRRRRRSGGAEDRASGEADKTM